MSRADDTVLRARGLVKSYRTGTETVEILRGVDLEVRRGTCVVVSGESGSGKTTLLNIVGGLDDGDAGTVEIDGTVISGLPEAQLRHIRRRRVGFVFQVPYLLRDFTALENVMMPALMAGEPRGKAARIARDLVHMVGLENRSDHFPSQLSGGERQRVVVARALVNDPALLLADEPTGSLDELNSRRVEDLVFRILEDRGGTLLLVTHDQALSGRGNRHLFLEHGVLTEG
jgi:lipoprotein-releasing system ATP-binding protein